MSVQDLKAACAVVGIPDVNMTPLSQGVSEEHHQRIAGVLQTFCDDAVAQEVCLEHSFMEHTQAQQSDY